jgi:hypothetical protein
MYAHHGKINLFLFEIIIVNNYSDVFRRYQQLRPKSFRILELKDKSINCKHQQLMKISKKKRRQLKLNLVKLFKDKERQIQRLNQ